MALAVIVLAIYFGVTFGVEREKKLPTEQRAPKRKLFRRENSFDESFSLYKKRGAVLFFVFLGIRYLLPYILRWIDSDFLWDYATELQYGLTLLVVLVLGWSFLLEGIREIRKHFLVRFGQTTLIWVVGVVLQITTTIFIELGLKLTDSNQEAINKSELTVGWVLTAVVVAPIVEEMIYRGWVYRFFRSRFPVGAHLINGVAFGVMHISLFVVYEGRWDQLVAVIPLMIIGVAFSVIYEKTGNITYPIFGHMMLNLVSTLS